MKRIVALVLLVLLIVAGIMAARWLPWWGIVLGIVLLVVVGKLVVGRIVRKLFLAPFRAKGAVLKGAVATVHAISPTDAPVTPLPTETPGATEADTNEDESESIEEQASQPDIATPHEYHLLEVTITPQATTTGPFGHWEPGELRLVRPESQLHPESDQTDDDDDACEVKSIQFNEDAVWKDDDGMKFPGPQRLKLHLAVVPGVEALKFRYYFEEFGVVHLPPS